MEWFDKFKSILSKISPKVKKIILAAGIFIIALSVGIAFYLNNKPYEILFSSLNQQEASEIIGKLQESGVAYKYETNGTIRVPKEQEAQLKAQLVYEGYPKNGFTYDVFKDNIGMMTTDFEKNSYKLFELQNRIGSTIRLFQGVKDAKVTIAMAEERKYVLDKNNTQKTSASVVIIMNDGGTPTEKQVKGIQRLVSKSIPNMEMDDVAVLDGNGNDVSSVGDSSAEGANKLKIDFEKQMDDSIRAKILNILSPIYGSDNIRVSVRTTVDVDKKIREIINHEAPVETSPKGIPGSETTASEIIKDGTNAGGVPGTETNADIPTYGQIEGDGSETYYKNESAVDYLVNQLKEQSQIDSGSIVDMTISVAVNGKTLGSVDEYQLKGLIANAAGISKEVQDDKITVVAAPFYNPDSPNADIEGSEGENNWIIIGTIATGVLLVILVIIGILISRRRKKKRLSTNQIDFGSTKMSKRAQEEHLRELMQKQQEEKENQILNLTNEKGLELKENVRKIAEENPEISAQLIRNWLKGGD